MDLNPLPFRCACIHFAAHYLFSPTREGMMQKIGTDILMSVPICPTSIFFTDRLSNKPFSVWLLTTVPCVKYVATLPCNLSFVNRLFSDITVSPGSLATYRPK